MKLEPMLQATAFALVLLLLSLSCKKELSCENCRNSVPNSNQRPVACAGTDRIITLPADTVTLDGSCSSDPNNNISAYRWTKISGPSSFHFSNAGSALTQVHNLVEGIYQFELKVTDSGGLVSKDTMQITIDAAPVATACDNSNRSQITARLIPIGTLSQHRTGVTVASAGNKILFAGGWFANQHTSSRVDIYDIPTKTWSTAELSVGRSNIAAVTNGNKIFFAGGSIETATGNMTVDNIDIYDVMTNKWTFARLSKAGHSIAAASLGNKVFFAGGNTYMISDDREKTVDIYNLSTSNWSTALLSVGKVGATAVAAKGKVYIAGGVTINPSTGNWYSSRRIDVYDEATNTWSTLSLQEGKYNFAGITVLDKIYWAGGYTDSVNMTSCLMEIRDVNTGNSSKEYLYRPAVFRVNFGQNAVVSNGKIIFYSSENSAEFDIYDIAAGTWSIGVLPIHTQEASVIAVNNIIYFAGGRVNGAVTDKVYKLEF